MQVRWVQSNKRLHVWKLESVLLGTLARISIWNNPDANKDNWVVHLYEQELHFLSEEMTLSDVKAYVIKEVAKGIRNCVEEIENL